MLVGKQIAPFPNAGCNVCLLGWSAADRTMNGQEVVSKQMQRNRGGKIHLAPRESQTQTNEAAHLCADGQNRSLCVSGANQIGIGIATNRPAVNSLETTWTIPLAAGDERRSKVFDLPP